VTVAKAPSMPFYGKQFYDDESVWLSSLAHQGLYVALLWNQWQEGSIPADVKKIAQLVGKPEREVRKLWPEVSGFFRPATDGRLVNDQLEKVRADMLKIRERRAEAGRKGNESRWQEPSQTDRKRDANGMTSGSPPVAVPSPSPVPEEENTIPPISGGSGGNVDARRDNRHSEWMPVWSQRAFQRLVDKTRDFLKYARSRHKVGPGDENFDAQFFSEFGMTWEYWTAQSERHQEHFGAMARGVA
jgi:uncharacterized protein YdaU (DUF1376 family)